MSYTLDELLEATGVDELAGTPFKKVAADDGYDLLKLAAQCREAALSSETTPSSTAVDTKDLVEKTAAVAVIRRTLAEIREIEGHPPEAIKTASQQGPDQAVFIKAALEQGHSPEEIARFLDEKKRKEKDEKSKKTATSIIG